MKVELVVVQGKPEGKVISLVGPRFKIGRGEGCNLRPNSEEVSREHAEFAVTATTVSVRDLGSRNGTLVNGKAVKEACVLKDRDLVQVGPLTFAVSIVGVPAASSVAPAPVYSKAAPEDVSHDDIETWLIADNKNPAPERPSGVYGGETITLNAYNDANATKDSAAPAEPKASKPAAAPAASTAPKAPAKPVAAKPVVPTPAPAPAPAPAAAATDYSDLEFERLSEGAGDAEDEQASEVPSEDEAEEKAEEVIEEYVDESNPFYIKKKAPEPATPAKKAPAGDTSDVARDILSKMMERKRTPR